MSKLPVPVTSKMESYGELDIFKDAKRLAVEVHKMSLYFPSWNCTKKVAR